jgi:hypothetical protein
MNRASLLLLAVALVSSGCDEIAVQEISAPLQDTSARVKFFNFGVGAPAVNFYANDAKMTAISSATGVESNLGVNFGGVAAGGLYLAVPAGQHTISGRIATATDKDLPISTLPATLAGGKAYSYYQSGIYDTGAKRVDSFIIEDPIPANFDFNTAYVRFVHAVSNANPMTLTLRERTEGTEVVIGGSVAYRSGSEFVKVPAGAYDLTTRYANGTTAMTRLNVGFANGRVYTIAARGNINTASTLLLDNTLNR